MHSSPNGKLPRPLALITGASSGLGAAFARELARDGYDPVLVARREAPMRTLALELAADGANTTVIAANLSVLDAACRLIATLESRGLEKIEVLINNAGFGDYARFIDAEPTRISEMMRLNMIAPTELLRAILPGMLARGHGRVLMVAAATAFAPGPGAAVYNATKSYLFNMGTAVGHELEGTGVTLTTLCPGPMHTGFAAASGGESIRFYQKYRAMDETKVARLGYRALKRGRRVVVPGFRNKVDVALTRPLWPRSTLALIARRNASVAPNSASFAHH
jgi:short-subunit dehydrogenase